MKYNCLILWLLILLISCSNKNNQEQSNHIKEQSNHIKELEIRIQELENNIARIEKDKNKVIDVIQVITELASDGLTMLNDGTFEIPTDDLETVYTRFRFDFQVLELIPISQKKYSLSGEEHSNGSTKFPNVEKAKVICKWCNKKISLKEAFAFYIDYNGKLQDDIRANLNKASWLEWYTELERQNAIGSNHQDWYCSRQCGSHLDN